VGQTRRGHGEGRGWKQDMSLIVKICGLSTAEALDVALDEGADMVGFVFFPPSPRHLAFEAARLLGERARGQAQKVALTVDADDAWFEAIVASLRPDLLQLHGSETAARVAALKRRFGLPVMKAVPIAQKDDLVLAANYIAAADRILFDARAPKEATRPGGLGRAFDWRLLENLALGVPFMLSGGLDAGNVAEALRITKAPGVDVSSGVERAPGEKDPDKIRAFIRAARKAALASALPG
jgi:phosphoribosylanthranilate isomerase